MDVDDWLDHFMRSTMKRAQRFGEFHGLLLLHRSGRLKLTPEEVLEVEAALSALVAPRPSESYAAFAAFLERLGGGDKAAA